MITESEIIEGLKERAQDTISHVYKQNIAKAISMVTKYGGNHEDAQNIFHDALLKLTENVIQGKFSGDSKVSTYLLGITKFMWFRELKRRKIHYVEMDQATENKQITLPDEPEEEGNPDMASMVVKQLKNIDDACRQILVAYYYEKRKLQDIAVTLDYTQQFIRVKKMRCLKKMKSLIQQ